MYLNEKAWNADQDNKYTIINALEDFLDIYQELIFKYHFEGVFVYEKQEQHIRSVIYPLQKWLAEEDIEYRRKFLSFWQKRITFEAEEEYEFLYKGERIEGATEAVLSDSFVISPCFTSEWQIPELKGELYSLHENEQQMIGVPNVCRREQLQTPVVSEILKRHKVVRAYSYKELWEKKEKLFPHLVFCPSVEKDLYDLEPSYMNQVIRKLCELEEYCLRYAGKAFDKDLLASKTTVEDKETLKHFKKEHTFFDSDKSAFLASWHMRFTGIPGRIFFVPDYTKDTMLIRYIGKKLKNVTYN